MKKVVAMAFMEETYHCCDHLDGASTRVRSVGVREEEANAVREVGREKSLDFNHIDNA